MTSPSNAGGVVLVPFGGCCSDPICLTVKQQKKEAIEGGGRRDRDGEDM